MQEINGGPNKSRRIGLHSVQRRGARWFGDYNAGGSDRRVLCLDPAYFGIQNDKLIFLNGFLNLIGSLGYHQYLTHCWHHGTRHGSESTNS